MPEATETEKALRADLARLAAELGESRKENKLLQEKIDVLVKRIFGAASEKLDPTDLQMLLKGIVDVPKTEEPVAAVAPQRSKDPSPPRKRQPRTPDDLEVVEREDVPAEVKQCPNEWRRIGEEITEQLDYLPGRFLKLRIVRPKYVRKDHPFAAPVIAPLQSLQERCIAAPGLIAAIIVGKYVDHLPLYRQEQIFATRHDVHLPRQTMAQWMGLAADWLQLIYRQMRHETLAADYVMVDETPIEYLSPGNGETKLGYLWTCARPGADTIFHWNTSRGAECLEEVFPEGWKGTLQCDGYSAYEAFANRRSGMITRAGCWAHARRALLEGKESAPRACGWLLNQIAQLYRIEAGLRANRAGPALREAIRKSQSAPILRRLNTAFNRLRDRYLPQSALGKAFTYILGQWEELIRFVENGRIEIDNNHVENAIRPTAIGKKNWLFIGAADAGERGAILYTIVEACRRRGLNPFEYIRDVLERLPKMTTSQISEITPGNWAKARRSSQFLRAA